MNLFDRRGPSGIRRRLGPNHCGAADAARHRAGRSAGRCRVEVLPKTGLECQGTGDTKGDGLQEAAKKVIHGLSGGRRFGNASKVFIYTVGHRRPMKHYKAAFVVLLCLAGCAGPRVDHATADCPPLACHVDSDGGIPSGTVLVPVDVRIHLLHKNGPPVGGGAALFIDDTLVARAETGQDGVAHLWGRAGQLYLIMVYGNDSTEEVGEWIRPEAGNTVSTDAVVYPWQQVWTMRSTLPTPNPTAGETWRLERLQLAPNQDLDNALLSRIRFASGRLRWNETGPGGGSLDPAAVFRDGTRTVFDSTDEVNGTTTIQHSQFFQFDLGPSDYAALSVGAHAGQPLTMRPKQAFEVALCLNFVGEGRWHPYAHLHGGPQKRVLCPEDLVAGPPIP